MNLKFSIKTKIVIYLFFFLVLLNFLIFQSPIIILFFMIILSIGPLLSLIPNTWRISPYSKEILELFIKLLKITNILDLIYLWYCFFNNYLTLKGFKRITLFFALLNVIYLIIARFIFYLKINNMECSFLLIILFFITFFGVFFRMLTNFSFSFIPFIFKEYPSYGILLTEIPEMPEIQESTTPRGNIGSGWFNKNTHHHYYPLNNGKRWWTIALTLGISCTGLGLTAYGCNQYRLSTLAQQESNRIQQVAVQAQQESNRIQQAAVQAQNTNNHEMRVQNDLEAYSQTLISKQQLCQTDIRFCTKDHVAEITKTMEASKKAGMPGIKTTYDVSIDKKK